MQEDGAYKEGVFKVPEAVCMSQSGTCRSKYMATRWLYRYMEVTQYTHELHLFMESQSRVHKCQAA